MSSEQQSSVFLPLIREKRYTFPSESTAFSMLSQAAHRYYEEIGQFPTHMALHTMYGKDPAIPFLFFCPPDLSYRDFVGGYLWKARPSIPLVTVLLVYCDLLPPDEVACSILYPLMKQ